MRTGLLGGMLLLGACAEARVDANGTTDARDGNGDGGRDDGGMELDASLGLTGWHPLGAPIGSSTNNLIPAVAIDGTGLPFVAIVAGTDTSSFGIEVHRAVNNAWTLVGPRIPTGTMTVPAIAATGSTYHVAWPAGSSRQVRTWNGASWSAPAGTPVGSYTTFLGHVSLALDAASQLWVAYNEHSAAQTAERVFVNANQGTSWPLRGMTSYTNALHETASPNQSALAPDLAAGAGAMFVAWQGNGVHVRQWNPGTTAWDAVGTGAIVPPPAAGVVSASTSAIGVDSAGRPTVIYHAYKGGLDGTLVFVARHDGASWIHIGQSLQAYAGGANGMATYATAQDIAVTAASDAYIAFTEEDATGESAVHVWRCASTGGCAPVGRGRLDADVGDASTARLALDGGGRPVVVWSELDAAGNSHVHVWRYFGDPDAP